MLYQNRREYGGGTHNEKGGFGRYISTRCYLHERIIIAPRFQSSCFRLNQLRKSFEGLLSCVQCGALMRSPRKNDANGWNVARSSRAGSAGELKIIRVHHAAADSGACRTGALCDSSREFPIPLRRRRSYEQEKERSVSTLARWDHSLKMLRYSSFRCLHKLQLKTCYFDKQNTKLVPLSLLSSLYVCTWDVVGVGLFDMCDCKIYGDR